MTMLLSLDELRNYDFSVSGIQVFQQKPNFRQQRHYSRKCNGFVYVLRGKCRFSYDGGGFTMNPDAICYLPRGSNHLFEVLEEGTEIYRVDFRITVDGEVALFSNGPLLITEKPTAECMEIMHKMVNNYAIIQNSLAKMELLCALFRGLARTAASQKRTAPAVQYLQKHPAERISVGELAKLCNLGTAQFYNLFQEEFGTTPLAYRDELLLQRAETFLQEEDFSVGEVAEILGFESAAYFSRFFKKHRGISPSKFAANRRERAT